MDKAPRGENCSQCWSEARADNWLKVAAHKAFWQAKNGTKPVFSDLLGTPSVQLILGKRMICKLLYQHNSIFIKFVCFVLPDFSWCPLDACCFEWSFKSLSQNVCFCFCFTVFTVFCIFSWAFSFQNQKQNLIYSRRLYFKTLNVICKAQFSLILQGVKSGWLYSFNSKEWWWAKLWIRK